MEPEEARFEDMESDMETGNKYFYFKAARAKTVGQCAVWGL